jgi:hypothetical protein
MHVETLRELSAFAGETGVEGRNYRLQDIQLLI